MTFDEILKGHFEDGKRYLLTYVSDYRSIMGSDPCINCGKKSKDYEAFKLKIKEMKDVKNSGFKLKAMYEGIPISRAFGSRDFVSNAILDDDKAIKLITEHPLGVKLFETLPKDFNIDEVSQKPTEREKELKSFSAEKLKDLAKDLQIDYQRKEQAISEILKAEVDKE